MKDNLLGFRKSIIISKSLKDGLKEQFISFYLIAVVMNYTKKGLFNYVTVYFTSVLFVA